MSDWSHKFFGARWVVPTSTRGEMFDPPQQPKEEDIMVGRHFLEGVVQKQEELIFRFRVILVFFFFLLLVVCGFL